MRYRALFESLRATLYRITGSFPFLALDPYTEDVKYTDQWKFMTSFKANPHSRWNRITPYNLKWRL